MNKMKKAITLCALLALVLVFSACSSGSQGANNPDGGVFTIEQIQDDPAGYVGTITLIGTVGASRTRDFSLQNEAGTFEIQVAYRGSQALPRAGSRISIEGNLAENRPCCGPGFTLTSTRFEEVR